MFNQVGLTLGLIGGLYFLPQAAIAQSNKVIQQSMNCDSLKSIAIHQEIEFKGSPGRIYQILLDEKQFSTLSADGGFPPNSAKIDSAVGGTFSLFGGHIIGRILELVPNQRIVEAWRVVDWPPGIYSIARFELISKNTGTLVIFDHTGFPEGLKDHLALGWQLHYWDPISKFIQ